ncbi:G2/mitotic-specific cyclin-B2 [Erpetoichthys calabaricus]|uniref:Cyclin B2 n=1 Tax=Erpetoichthys calabaricus TaxID=27687 RepID=A0A8C4TJ32_ERPCA|nr:G2/mitotic-specific cyclin-B2 [Erpetoichthys calabaricus]
MTLATRAANVRDVENMVGPKLKSQGEMKRAVLGELSNWAGVKGGLVKKTESFKASVMKGPPVAATTKPTVNLTVRERAAATKNIVPTSRKNPEEELCQAFSCALLNIHDIDVDDAENPQLCSEYVKDIYQYLRQLELQQSVRPRFLEGQEINERMRAILLDWLIQVHSRFQLLQETLYLTVSILDRFLQIQPVSRKRLQLVGVTAMFIASKYEEIYPPGVGDFVYITDDTFSKAQVYEMEILILQVLNFELGRPLPPHFLRRASKAGHVDSKKHTLAKYLMELTLLDYVMAHYHPSEIAAAGLCLSQKLLDGSTWSPVQVCHTGYSTEHLEPIIQHMAKNVVKVNEGLTKYVAVKNKYSSSKLLKISTVKELNSTFIKELAAPLLKKN